MRYLKPIIKGTPRVLFVLNANELELISGHWNLKSFLKLLKNKNNYAIISNKFCRKKCNFCKKYLNFMKQNKNKILITISEENIPYIIHGDIEPEYKLYIKNFINEVFNEI